MAARHIIAVGFHLPIEADIQWVDIRSDQALADADIILFKPRLEPYLTRAQEEWGTLTLADDLAWAFDEEAGRWRDELQAALDHGKTVIVFLSRYQEVTLDLHKTETVSNYLPLPIDIGDSTTARGQKMRLTGRLPALATYWKEFGAHSTYEMYLDRSDLEPLIVTLGGDRVVGGMARVGKGTIVALPPLTIEPPNRKSAEFASWPDRCAQIGQRLVDLVVGLDRALRAEGGRTPPPPWLDQPGFRTGTEARLIAEIERVSARLAALQAERDQLAVTLGEESRLRDLLFETGKPLERAIVTALRLLGFEADPYQDAESEFDAVFTSPEGRFLGEAEGKDNKAVNIDKLDQLNRNLGEDFARDDVEEYAKGILFGNASRLEPLDARGEYFTAKCLTGAARSRAALVRTPDLFAVARYLRDHDDPAFARACREAIASTEGAIVAFPVSPTTPPG